MNKEEELSDRVQELDEELTMALTEVKRTNDISKHLNEVRPSGVGNVLTPVVN